MTDRHTSIIVDHVLRLEPALDRPRIEKVVAAVGINRSYRMQLSDLVQNDPRLLTSGDSDVPALLARLIRELVKVGATQLRETRCSRCGEPRKLAGEPGQPRICNPCRQARGRRRAICSWCGNDRERRPTVLDIDVCIGCWKTATLTSHARLLEVVRQHARPLTTSQLSDVIQTAIPTPNRQLALAINLEAHAAEWFKFPAAGDIDFIRLCRALVDAGASLPPLVCGHCGVAAPLTLVVGELRSCRKCYSKATSKQCGRCGTVGRVAFLLPDGMRLCQTCTLTAADIHDTCVVCHEHRRVVFTGSEGPVCSRCRRIQKADICQTCLRVRPCRFSGTENAICEECARSRAECVTCRRVAPVATREEGGGALCTSCAPSVVEQCVSCGRSRPVHGRTDGKALCNVCWPKHPASFNSCARCETVAFLNRERLCISCDAADALESLLPSSVAQQSPAFASLRQQLADLEPQKFRWLLKRNTTALLLRELLTVPDGITHEALDASGSDSATRMVRALLIEHGILPSRDDSMVKFEQWVANATQRIDDPISRRAFREFANWHHLRQLRRIASRGRVPASITSSRRAELNQVAKFLTTINAHGVPLHDVTQADVDRWLLDGPLERFRLKRFFQWTRKASYSRRLDMKFPQPKAVLVQQMSFQELNDLGDKILDSDAAAATTRFAAALMLLFGTQPHQLVTMTPSDVWREGDEVFVRLGSIPLRMPPLFAGLAEEAILDRHAPRPLGGRPDFDWLFPGSIPGQPMSKSTLTERVRKLGIQPQRVRRNALVGLSMELPPAVLARLTGMSKTAAIRWSNAVGASRSRYSNMPGT